MRRLRRATLVLAIAASLGACGPQTPEDRFRSALRRGDVEAVEKALGEGMSPVDPLRGDPPLHVVAASHTAEAELIGLLVEKGADPAGLDDEGRTPWDVVWEENVGAITSRESMVLIALIDAGFRPPDVPGPRGEGLLHRVAEKSQSVRLVELLVKEHGLAVDARDEFGWTPLHYAAHAWNEAGVVALLQLGADPNAESTKPWERTRQVKGSTTVDFRYAAGSRPLDVLHAKDRSRGEADVREPLREYGGKENPAVENRHR